MPLNPSAYVTGGEETSRAAVHIGVWPGGVGMGAEKITLMPMGRGLTHASPPF